MPQQILAILKADAGSPQSSAKCVLQIMYPDLGQVNLFSCPQPGAIQHSGNGPAIVCEDIRSVLTAALIDYAQRNMIQHH